jgi:TIR domain
MSDIFISYASEDRPRARTIAHALEAEGWSVWWDRNIPAGKRFTQVIEEEIGKARCIVVLWSAISVTKDWVIEEALDGRERQVLVPVFVERVQPPRGFRLLQAADLSEWPGEPGHVMFRQLCRDISGLLGPPWKRSTEKTPVENPKHDSPTSSVEAQPTVVMEPRTNPKDGLTSVWIPPGTFTMGCSPGDDACRDDEKPTEESRIANGFWLGQM